ncbi:molybdenum ABC transporter ATP-binding protein [Desulfovibrio sp. OttesenSCG-928-C06]|nr:molybdenum ABC transporter ATP-binding protein [Desulfovibrio sp. OttesenSCG-928-C06]
MQVSVKRRQGNLELDVSFTGAPSGITALFGNSGAGKTSVINMVAGLSRPDQGHISIGGRCLFDSGRGINLPPDKRRVGYVFQEGRLFPHLSVQSNLTYGMYLVPEAERKIAFDDVVGLLGIELLLERRPRLLSGGEKQRVAIGRALLTSPRALLMDEPLASLDEARKSELLPFIARISREFCIPILYVSHAMDEIRKLTDHVVYLHAGRVVEGGD